MTFTVAFTDILEVADETSLASFGITAGNVTKLDRATLAAMNDLFSIIGQRKDRPATLPTSGGSRQAILSFVRYRIYASRPETLIMPAAGYGAPKHPVVYDYETQRKEAEKIRDFIDGADWPELTDRAAEQQGQWGSDERTFDAWDRGQKQGDGSAEENALDSGFIGVGP